MDTVTEKVKSLEKTTKAQLTILWHEIEEWQQDNIYITRGYRPASNSYLKSASSLSYLHNETVNIYTHLLGSVLSTLCLLTLLYSTLLPRYETASATDTKVFACFFAGATACLTLSATFHTLSNHSPRVHAFGNQLDYLGIVCMIWGSFIPSIYYSFHAEHPELVTRYWGMISTLAILTGTTTLLPQFRRPKFRPFRAGMFVALGLSSVFPVLHAIELYGYSTVQRTAGVDWMITQGVLYILGAGIYAARVPERWAPGRFDIVGSSHQIFHVLVLMAAAAHFRGLLVAFDTCHGLKDVR